jgi:alpha-beta hydrolase superfamily lysophospholipase
MKVSGIRAPLEFRVLHINGIALHVVLAGPASGKPLIFLHGFPEFWFAWRGQIDHFVSSGYRVILPDQRGYNLSEKPAGIANYSIELLAQDVVGLLDNVAGSKALSSDTTGEVLLPGTWLRDARKRVSRTAIIERPPPPPIS